MFKTGGKLLTNKQNLDTYDLPQLNEEDVNTHTYN